MPRTEDDQPDAPIVVPASSALDQVFSILRQLAVGVAGYLVGKGIWDGELVGIILPAALALGPVLWAQVSIARKQARAVAMATALPDKIATIR